MDKRQLRQTIRQQKRAMSEEDICLRSQRWFHFCVKRRIIHVFLYFGRYIYSFLLKIYVQ